MVTSICSVTSPPRLRGSMISRRVAAPLRSLMRGGSVIWMALLLSEYYPFSKRPPKQEVTCRKSPDRPRYGSINRSQEPSLNTALSRAELEHRYRKGLRKLRGPTFLRRIRMTDKTVRGLIKRGYLGPEERDNLTAIQQAMSLFLWDDLREQPEQINGVENMRSAWATARSTMRGQRARHHRDQRLHRSPATRRGGSR
jgi:hypothetical protein